MNPNPHSLNSSEMDVDAVVTRDTDLAPDQDPDVIQGLVASVAALTEHFKRSMSHGRRQQATRLGKCFNCGKPEHFARDCRGGKRYWLGNLGRTLAVTAKPRELTNKPRVREQFSPRPFTERLCASMGEIVSYKSYADAAWGVARKKGSDARRGDRNSTAGIDARRQGTATAGSDAQRVRSGENTTSKTDRGCKETDRCGSGVTAAAEALEPREKEKTRVVVRRRRKSLRASATPTSNIPEDADMKAMKSLSPTKRMTISVNVMGEEETALIDSGCSAMVMSRNLAARLNLKIRNGIQVGFRFADGLMAQSHHVTNATIRKGEYEKEMTFHVLDITNALKPFLMSIIVTRQDLVTGCFEFTE